MQQSIPRTVTRRNPLRTFQFRLQLDPGSAPDYIAGVRTVSGLSWSLSAHETWSGGNNYHRYATPDRITWEPLTLEQGLALDDTLEQWADAARDFHRGGASSGGVVKRRLTIDLWDRSAIGTDPSDPADSRLLRRYTVRNAWVSKFTALPKLDAMASEVAFQSIEITHEGWKLDPPTS